jgi:hypothetical protein
VHALFMATSAIIGSATALTLATTPRSDTCRRSAVSGAHAELDCGPALTVGAGQSVARSRGRAQRSVSRSDPHTKE